MRLPQLLSSILFLSAVLSATACGGSDKPVDEPAQPAADVAASGHLTIVPVVMTSTATKPDGTTKVRIIRVDADGVISVEEDGTSKELARLAADGTFSKLDGDASESLRLDETGTFHINGKPFAAMRVGDDGTLYRGDEALLRIEGGKVIDVTGEFLKSTFSFNGETQTTTFEIAIEGGDEARRLAGILLGLQMLPGKQEAPPASEASSGAEPAVAPTVTP